MEEDEALYSKLFGETARNVEFLNPRGSRDDDLSQPLPPSRPSQGHQGLSQLVGSLNSNPLPNLAQVESKQNEFQGLADAGREFDDDEDEDFDVKLDQPEPQDEDDLDLKLDDTDEAQAPMKGNAAATADKASRPGTFTRNSQSGVPGIQGDSAATTPAARPAHANQARPMSYPEYDPNDPGVLPSQATEPGQRIRLPGQTRVTADEYKEFLGLGHGDIFNLDIDCVIDAPWRVPGADQSEFFNYGLLPRTWKDYSAKVQQFKADLSMLKNIPGYDYGAPRWGPDREREHRPGGATDQSQGWNGQANGSTSGRLALPSPERRDNDQPGAAFDLENGSLPMPDMSSLPLPPFGNHKWDM